MLGKIDLNRLVDPIISIVALVNNNETEDKELEPGFYEIGDFSFDFRIWNGNGPFDFAYPDLENLSCYGVCDTQQQFIDRYKQQLIDDERTFVVSFTHVKKNPESGGWRWHKWGPYIGDGTPTCEYLGDEEGFEDGVYCYHVYRIK